MQIALDKYYQDYGYYPQKLTPAPFAHPLANSNGVPYLENYEAYQMKDTPPFTETGFMDAWGKPFYYQCPGTMNPEKYDLWSTGLDQKMGVIGIDDNNDGTYIDFTTTQFFPSETDSPFIPDYGDAQTPNAQDSDDITNWKRH
jgi:hypothetical protein